MKKAINPTERGNEMNNVKCEVCKNDIKSESDGSGIVKCQKCLNRNFLENVAQVLGADFRDHKEGDGKDD